MQRHVGFTLLELAVAVVLLAVVAAMAAPAFTGLIERSRAQAAFHGLTASLAGARLAALKARHPVTICPTTDGQRCRRDLVWDDGWMIYLDADRRDHPGSAGAVIQHVGSTGAGISVRSSRGRHRVRFQPDGWASGANLSLQLCSRKGRRLLGAVVVNNAGRPRSERLDAAAGSCPYAP